LILTGDQPDYLPYIGFFHKMMNCDLYMIVDHVQFSKKSFQNRNRIRSSSGEIMLTVPVFTKGKFEQSIDEVLIDNEISWQKKHQKTIFLNYKKSSYYDDYKDFFEDIFSQKWEKLIDLNEYVIRFLSKKLEINVNILKSSTYNFKGKKTDLLIEMCNATNADFYLSGEGGKNYVDDKKFEEHSLTNLYTNFIHPTYKQKSKSFLPRMSVIDLLLNNEIKLSKSIIQKSGKIGK
jgi:hypothetical protein